MQSAKRTNFRSYLQSLVTDHGINPDAIWNGLTRKESQALCAQTLLKIAENLSVDATSLWSQSLNIEALKNSLKANPDLSFIPSIYRQGAFSSTTSLRSVVNEFKKFGKHQQILKMLQLNSQALEKHLPISVHVVQRVLSFMQNFISTSEIQGIAKRNADSFLSSSDFGEYFRNDLSCKTAGEAMFENANLIEKNWSYKILSSRPDQVIVETSQSEEMLDICSKDYTTEHMIKLRFQFIKRVFEHIDNGCLVHQLTPTGKYGHFTFSVEYTKTKPLSYQSQLCPVQ